MTPYALTSSPPLIPHVRDARRRGGRRPRRGSPTRDARDSGCTAANTAVPTAPDSQRAAPASPTRRQQRVRADSEARGWSPTRSSCSRRGAVAAADACCYSGAVEKREPSPIAVEVACTLWRVSPSLKCSTASAVLEGGPRRRHRGRCLPRHAGPVGIER